MTYQVLVPVDDDRDRAFHQAEYVERLADGTDDIEATILYVVPPSEFEQADAVSFSEVEGAVDAAERLETAGVSVNRVVGDGGVAQEIDRVATDRDVDEVVMGGRNRSGVVQVLLGSTVLDVMLSSDRPVTITGEKSVVGEGTRQVLVPIDRSEERAMNQAEYVAGLPTAPDRLEATVFYVFPHLDYAGAPDHEFDEIDAAVAAADHLEGAGISVERAAVGGEVTRTILERADEDGADAIVVGGRKRSGIQKVLLGSTAQDIILGADRPVTITG